MANHEDDELQMALRMSMQPAPEPKRSKPREVQNPSSDDCETEEIQRQRQRELRLAAAEKRRSLNSPTASPLKQNSPYKQKSPSPQPQPMVVEAAVVPEQHRSKPSPPQPRAVENEGPEEDSGVPLGNEEAQRLFYMVFGEHVSKDILSQWCNQGFRFSNEPDTAFGLVQREGGPCGVLAAVQALALKHLLFGPSVEHQGVSQTGIIVPESFSTITENQKRRALILAMTETLFLAGSNRRAVIATLNIEYPQITDSDASEKKEEVLSGILDGLSINSAAELQNVLKVHTVISRNTLLNKLEELLPVFESRMGALLFLFSALLSRSLDAVQNDRDDPGPPLVTAPFGHASQEIVNLLLCGQAVSNVFDGSMDLGDGMFLKGIPTTVEVGFLSLLEFLNFCKVGQYLKQPKWPIWVVGSESHYTVLFAFNVTVQNENELEHREIKIKNAFDVHDQSGGGGFISADALRQLLSEMQIELPRDKLQVLCSSDFVVWNDLWQVLLQLDRDLGGLKDPSGNMGKKQFDLYHFNGIAKTVSNSTQSVGETIQLRPRLTKLRVTVPPKWTPEEYMSQVSSAQGNSQSSIDGSSGNPDLVIIDEPPQHAPLVDCIRTRWPRATCNWMGDPPSIV